MNVQHLYTGYDNDKADDDGDVVKQLAQRDRAKLDMFSINVQR